MKTTDREFIEALGIEEVPWNRLATPYYRAVEFPELLEAITDEDAETADEAAGLLAANIETESILWQPAPFAMVFLARITGCAVENYLKEPNTADADLIMRILSIYAPIFDALEGIDDEHPNPVSAFSEMLADANLLPDDNNGKEDDVLVGEFYENVSEELFYSFFHYAWLLLAQSLNDDVSRLEGIDEKEISAAVTLFKDSPLFATLQKIIKA